MRFCLKGLGTERVENICRKDSVLWHERLWHGIGHKKTLEPLYLIDFDFRPDCKRLPLIAASGASY